MKSPVEMMRALKENSLSVQAAEKLSGAGDEGGIEGKIVRGVLHDEDKPEYTELYDQLIERAHGTPPMRKRQVRRGWM
jgi:2-oxoglutarate ferredoxin oxidoreductase subunit beta